MKHLFQKALFLCCCILHCSAFCQGTLYKVPFDGTSNIIRYDDANSKFITCSNYASSTYSGYYFALFDLNTMINIPIPDKLIIRDCEIIDNYVFFCGEVRYTTSGFLGWFDIDSFFYYGTSLHVDMQLINKNILSLENIELYHDILNNICVAGYGLYFGSSPYCVFEAVGNPTTVMKYRALNVVQDFNDMAVTQKYVVYLGKSYSSCFNDAGFGINLTTFPKYNMLDIPPYQSHYFQTVTDNNAFPPYILFNEDEPYHYTTPMIVNTTENEVAVCSYRRNYDYTGYSTTPTTICYDIPLYAESFLALRTYDLTPLTYSNPIVMTNAYTVKLNYADDLYSINEFLYNPITKDFLILHKAENSTSLNESFVTTFNHSSSSIPFSSSEMHTAYSTTNDWRPTSMCLHGNASYMLSGYIQSIPYFYVFWNNAILTPNNNCTMRIHNLVTPIPTQPHKKNEFYFTKPDWTLLAFDYIVPSPISQENSDIICTY